MRKAPGKPDAFQPGSVRMSQRILMNFRFQNLASEEIKVSNSSVRFYSDYPLFSGEPVPKDITQSDRNVHDKDASILCH